MAVKTSPKKAAKVKAIPKGHHAITPHMVVRDGAKAVEFYKKAFGAEEVSQCAGPDGKLMHAELKIGDSFLFLCDEFPGMNVKGPQSLGGTSVTIHLYVEDADATFDRAVAAGCQAKMPLMDMFWGDRFGKLTDPFGHEWSVAMHIEDVPPEEMNKRAQEAMAKMGSDGSCQ